MHVNASEDDPDAGKNGPIENDADDDAVKNAQMAVLVRNIKAAMAAAGFESEASVAVKAGLTRDAIREMRDPRRYKEPGVLRLIKIARALGVSVSSLLDGIEDPHLRTKQQKSDRTRVNDAIRLVLEIERQDPQCLQIEELVEIADILIASGAGPIDPKTIPATLARYMLRRKR